jgi:hypothetical protein
MDKKRRLSINYPYVCLGLILNLEFKWHTNKSKFLKLCLIDYSFGEFSSFLFSSGLMKQEQGRGRNKCLEMQEEKLEQKCR